MSKWFYYLLNVLLTKLPTLGTLGSSNEPPTPPVPFSKVRIALHRRRRFEG